MDKYKVQTDKTIKKKKAARAKYNEFFEKLEDDGSGVVKMEDEDSNIFESGRKRVNLTAEELSELSHMNFSLYIIPTLTIDELNRGTEDEIV
jgi:hypothetical protein